jgi:hypothetical protein
MMMILVAHKAVNTQGEIVTGVTHDIGNHIGYYQHNRKEQDL